MIRNRTGKLALVVAVLATLPSALLAQGQPEVAPLPVEGIPPEASAWIQEIQEIHARLTELQERALADPELSAQRDTLGNHIKVAMETLDPTLLTKMGRIEEMEQQASEAHARNDEATLNRLRAEAEQIEEQFFTVQQIALQQPALAAEVSAFQTVLEQRIRATDPDAPRLLARFQELEEKLSGLAEEM